MELNVRHIVINAVLFQALWFSAVMLGWVFALPLLCLMAWHLLLTLPAIPWVRLALLACVGILADSLASGFGFYGFPSAEALMAGFIPFWLVCLWLGFVLTLIASLQWLRRHTVAFAFACAIAGPASYWAGVKLGALILEPSALFVTCGIWFGFGLVSSVVLKPGANTAVPSYGARNVL